MAAHPLEAAIASTVQEHTKMLKEIHQLKTDLDASEHREAILKGRIETLDSELVRSKERSDHYLRWNVEITRQLQNIGMFVNEAMAIARVEVQKGNSKDMPQALEAVEKAITDVTVQRKDD